MIRSVALLVLLASAMVMANDQALLGKFANFKARFGINHFDRWLALLALAVKAHSIIYQLLLIGKQYSCEHEESERLSIFKANLERAGAMQAMDGDATYGITKFMDLTAEEFKAMYLNYKPSGAIEAAVLPTPRFYQPNADGFDWYTIPIHHTPYLHT
jgi:hypothetical protein